MLVWLIQSERVSGVTEEPSERELGEILVILLTKTSHDHVVLFHFSLGISERLIGDGVKVGCVQLVHDFRLVWCTLLSEGDREVDAVEEGVKLDLLGTVFAAQASLGVGTEFADEVLGLGRDARL